MASTARNWRPQPQDPEAVAQAAAALSALFDMTPESAIAYLRSLGIKIDWNWREDLAQMGDLGFSIAHVADVDILAAVKDEIIRALRDGITARDFRRYLSGRLASLGWLGQREIITPDGATSIVDLSRADRMNVIFRTNAQSAYMAGRYEAQVANIVAQPFGMYVAILDARTRPAHREMHGRVYRLDDPIWRVIYPPCGFNCRCRVVSFTQDVVDERGINVRDTSDALPDGFPDDGFGNNPGVPGAFDRSIAAALTAAEKRLRG